MVMGQSAGRSRGNRTTGDRRATPRERAHIDPPGRDEWEQVKIQEQDEARIRRNAFLLDAMALGIWIFLCIVLSLIVAAWFNLI